MFANNWVASKLSGNWNICRNKLLYLWKRKIFSKYTIGYFNDFFVKQSETIFSWLAYFVPYQLTKMKVYSFWNKSHKCKNLNKCVMVGSSIRGDKPKVKMEIAILWLLRLFTVLARLIMRLIQNGFTPDKISFVIIAFYFFKKI